MQKYVGPALILVFVLSTGLRDVYFGNLLQGLNFFAIVTLSFSLAIAVFLLPALWWRSDQIRIAFRQLDILLWLNIATALAWLCYFFAIKWLEPSAVNTIWSGLGPILVSGISAMGWKTAGSEPIGQSERAFHLGILVSLMALVWVIMSGRSGLPGRSSGESLLGLAATALSATAIVASVLLSKRLNEKGVDAATIVGVRFFGLVLVSLPFAWGDPIFVHGLRDMAILRIGLAALFLIVLPIYFFQAGLQRSAPITAEAITALGPIMVFLPQLTDTRLTFSLYTLACIVLYALLTSGAALARARALATKIPIGSNMQPTRNS
ncbi:MAG TPA: hypothetical protein VHL08_10440 [Dongiaceae bacterium]|jgi:drug/metabolite transporter (DMT)-like permease|nr:hypothetical protein [Dongiaceae bacterium]